MTSLRPMTLYLLGLSGVALMIFLAPWLDRSLELDGSIYTAVALNLAKGSGDLWAPRFTDTVYPLFAEHPPLQFWLHSVLYRLFGANQFSDSAYNALILSALLATSYGIWRNLAPMVPRSSFVLSLTMWLLCPGLIRLHTNNYLENTVLLFALPAVLLMLVSRDRAIWQQVTLWIGSGLLVGAACLAKGPVGLFPLATLGVFACLGQARLRDGILGTCVVVLAVISFFTVLWQLPAPHVLLSLYLDGQVLGSLSGGRGNQGGGFEGVSAMASITLPPLLLTGLIIGFASKGRFGTALSPPEKALRRQLKPSLIAMGIMALGASVPMLLSPRIWMFYFTLCLPFVILAAGLWLLPYFGRITAGLSRIPDKVAMLVSGASLVGGFALAALALNSNGKDAGLLHVVDQLGQAACEGQPPCTKTIAICPALATHWHLHAYTMRYTGLSLNAMANPGGAITLSHASCQPQAGNATDLGAGFSLVRP